ncbi:MAG: RraA family protein [Actinomycetales bacterium]|nr:RraA family protein [Actinomycetales bacterium]
MASDPVRMDNPALDRLAESVYAAVVSDVCDRLGWRTRTMAPGLRVLSGSGVLIGFARAVRAEPVSRPPIRHYGAEIDLLDSLRPGEVVVADTGGSDDAFWGELFATAARARGARGVIVDGYVRDLVRLQAMDFGVHARGTRPADSLGRLSIVAGGMATVCGVEVRDGDLVVADADGVTVVPAEIAEQAIPLAVEKAAIESDARVLLQGGALLADAWQRYQVL